VAGGVDCVEVRWRAGKMPPGLDWSPPPLLPARAEEDRIWSEERLLPCFFFFIFSFFPCASLLCNLGSVN
jgi:hypothetical protein